MAKMAEADNTGVFLSDCDCDYKCDERSWKSDSNEGKDASLNRKKPYSSGQFSVSE